ncbi:ElyC/SanA/YdcF family protein [Paradesulfitobacterium aromaticivorans]
MLFRKKLKFVVLAVAVLLTIASSTVLLINYHVQSFSSKYILDADSVPQTDAILVLGAYVAPNGQPSDMLKDRLDTALEVHAQSKAKFLVSGDHGRTTYNEVNSMKKYIMDKQNIPNQDIFMDHAGFSTYESLYRAKEIFGVNKVVIVTQRYHLMRAIYIARNLGLEAYGVAADKHIYRGIEAYELREIAARNKDFLYVNVLRPKPTFLGEAIPISGDGRLTNDQKQ